MAGWWVMSKHTILYPNEKPSNDKFLTSRHSLEELESLVEKMYPGTFAIPPVHINRRTGVRTWSLYRILPDKEVTETDD
jgi:hypothetical protein